jgi:hypothetical protein
MQTKFLLQLVEKALRHGEVNRVIEGSFTDNHPYSSNILPLVLMRI